MRRVGSIVLAVACLQAVLTAHSGPPYPIVSKRQVGAYVVSLWTDPDTTDDGSAAGQFWLVFDGDGRQPGDEVRVDVAVWPSDRDGMRHQASAAPVDGDRARRFAALPMDHEGPFNVSVSLSGEQGSGTIDAEVDATYDQRPQPYLLAIYLLPFVLVGGLWVKRMRQRFTRTAT